MQHVNQFSCVFEVVQLPRLWAEDADKRLLFDDETASVPLVREVNSAGLCQLSRSVKRDSRLAELPPPEDVEAGEVGNFTGKPIFQNLSHGVIGGNLPHIFEQPVGADNLAIVGHHLFVFAEDLNRGADSGDEEVCAA